MEPAFKARLLVQYDVQYFKCSHCMFLRTEHPYWLGEAYSQAIAATDTGIVLRNIKIARQLTCVLSAMFGPEARYLDVAGGTGLLTRMMRDYGFDFFWEDPYCQNALAHGFEAPQNFSRYEAVTAFEALEHMEQPYDFIRRCIERSASSTFIFTTELFTPPEPALDWWYFSRITGQHIAFFSAPTLQRVAQQLGLRFLSHCGLHMLTRHNLPEDDYRKLLDQESHGLFEQVTASRQSYVIADHKTMVQRVLQAKHGSLAELDALIGSGLLPPAQPAKQGNKLERLAQRWQRSLRKRMRWLKA